MSPKKSKTQGGSINERIGHIYSALSKSHKITADYVVANSFRAATMSIDELADAVGISNATANRFARALGFDGYPQFRAELVSSFETMLAPIEGLKSDINLASSAQEVIHRSISDDIANLEIARREFRPALYERAVKMILVAERIYIIGYGASAYLGGIMCHALTNYCDSVQTNMGTGGPAQVSRTLYKFTERDLVIAISFPRYSSDIVTLMGQAQKRRIPMIALTDRPTSPVASLADVNLYVQTKPQFNSEGIVLCLIEAICAAVAHQSEASVDIAAETTELMLPWLHHGKK
ncbi:MurR/RpiR family transcriptional regulator [Undibacterium fentianense]|uniref:MurR/RpiR family transcriptional regulator n=1 Tax=Undibacterium fentianense TaxID=2828728 RepID=A0A941IFN1_9BURK|nr:MurR/RpiR family transcriptional regulator [Undibacterium fentianense]MBR7800896.1 MurR/RpiR family transcriptional regulator [Undibacterium fentianense]